MLLNQCVNKRKRRSNTLSRNISKLMGYSKSNFKREIHSHKYYFKKQEKISI